MKFYKTFFFLLFSLSLTSQSVEIGSIDFYPLNGSKPKGALFGNLEVFENNIDQKGKKIILHIEIIPAKNQEYKKAPMFILMGGPGQASSDLISFFSEIFSKMNEERDLVFMDQRGTGKSNPLQLDMHYDNLQDYFKDALTLDETVKETYKRLAESNDLKKYGTLNAARDIESVRDAMGYDKINIYGTSYGTRLALAYINKYPGKVKTATLKGLVPENLVIPLDFAYDSQEGLNRLIDECIADEHCSTTYPNFKEEFDALMNRTYPIDVSLTNTEKENSETIRLTKESIALTIRSLLSVPTFTQQIPFIISEANKGNFNVLAELILRIKKSSSKGIYTGMLLCVVCYEDYPQISETETNDVSHTFLKNIWTNRVLNACKIWNPSMEEATRIKYTKHDIPVLLISGERDAATPQKYGNQVLKKFKNGKHIIVSNAGHSFDRMLDCVEHIINDFVIGGTTQNLNLNCIQSIEFPDFKMN